MTFAEAYEKMLAGQKCKLDGDTYGFPSPNTDELLMKHIADNIWRIAYLRRRHFSATNWEVADG